MPLVPLAKLVSWGDFIEQLEPEEIEVYSMIRYMAHELSEPQEIILYETTIGIIWPSGAFQPAFRIPDGQKPSLNEFIQGALP